MIAGTPPYSLRPLQTAGANPLDRHRVGAILLGANVVGLLALAVFYRLWELNHLPGINGDEAWYGIQAMKLLAGEDFAWRTPTNNLLNAFYFLPLLALHALWEPSAALLRLPAVLSGLLALPVNYMLCRKLFGGRTALISTLLLAVLPVNIAYSRFGWDASQTLLATLLVVYLPLLALRSEATASRWLIAAAVAFVAALWVHPTNIFTAPLIATPLLWLRRSDILALWRKPRSASHWFAAAAALLAVVAGVGWLARHWVSAVGHRLLSPGQLAEFAGNYQRLVSGVTVYRYIPGSLAADEHSWGRQFDLLPIDLAVVLLFVVCAAALWPLVRRDENGFDRCLLAGWGLSLLGFYLVAGPGAIAPHFERYGLCLIAPAALLAARCFDRWLQRASSIGPVLSALGLMLAWLTLAGFHQHYFAFFHRTGGESHATFRTGQLEPKQAALEYIGRQSPAAGTTWIVTSEYWNDQPLRYLAAGTPDVRITDAVGLRQMPDGPRAFDEGRVWFVEFTDSLAHRALRQRLADESLDAKEVQILDYAGRPVLSVIKRQYRSFRSASISKT